MAKLVLSAGESVMYQCFIDKERLTVGRDASNQIVVDDPAVSREQAAILAIGNDHIVEDLASANGTFVNGKRVPRRILQHGDVIELGRFRLRYLNPRASSEADLERTMLIPGLVRDGGAAHEAPDAAAPRTAAAASRTPRNRFPQARVMMLLGNRSGSVIELDRVVATFGRPGKQLAVINRRPHGFFIMHVEGRRRPRVNGRPIGSEPVQLRNGDLIEVADEKLEFILER